MASKLEIAEAKLAKLKASNGTIADRLKRSKLWAALAGMGAAALCAWLGVPIEATLTIVGPPLAYILGQGFVDGMKAAALKKK